jgi:hypothetical protein
MKIVDLLEGAEKGGTTLGGFPVKVLHIQDSGQPEIDEEGVAEGTDDKFSVADKVEELVDQYRLYDKRGWTELFTKIAGRKLEVPEIRREMEYASKFLNLLDSIRMRSDYRGQQDPRSDQELIDLSNQWLSLFNKATGEFKGISGQGVEEGFGSTLAGLGLAGAMAFGAGGANARTTPGDDPSINRLTGKPIAAQQATDNAPTKAEAPKGFNKEYLQAVVDGKHPRPMVSVEKAKELLNNMQEGVAEGLEQLDRIRKLSGLDEALKIDAPQQAWSKQDMQDYATRIKTGTKTKQDRFKPIIHGSNIKAITKDDGGEEWDLDDLAKQITTRPRAILGTNAKMAKSKKEGAITYDLTLPALSGIVVDEDTGEFVEIITCPGAGECQNYCYARKGGYVMFPASSMSAAQALNFLVNHPTDYMKMFDGEVKKAKALADKNGIKLLVRIHDAGDFFSKEYYNLVMGVKADNPGVTFYFYTKMGDIASADQPDDVIGQFSPGAKSREVKAVQAARAAGKHVKDAVTLPKDMFRDLFVTDAKGKYVKDDQGRTQVKSSEVWSDFQRKLAAEYKIDPESIITYDQMNKIPEPESTGTKDQLQKDGTIKQVPVYPPPKWNVVIFPAGHGDVGAARRDVSKQFLMFH